MRILAVADEECAALWDYYMPGRLREYDLILACGDLKAEYLSFLVTMAHCPVLYVPGNHDTGYSRRPPEGCDCIDGRLVEYNGLRILGLGGCRRYHPGPHQYTDREMARRIRKLRYPLWRAGGVDIVVTHAPPRGYGDGEDRAHWGFDAMLPMLDRYQPGYLVHGHVHMCYGIGTKREVSYGPTRIVNAYERFVLDVPDREVPEKKKDQLIWRSRKPKEQK